MGLISNKKRKAPSDDFIRGRRASLELIEDPCSLGEYHFDNEEFLKLLDEVIKLYEKSTKKGD